MVRERKLQLVSPDVLEENGCAKDKAAWLAEKVNHLLQSFPPEECWRRLTEEILAPTTPFSLHLFLFNTVYDNWDTETKGPPPAWLPSESDLASSNIAQWMRELNLTSYHEFHRWSVENREEFWSRMIKKLDIVFDQPATEVVDLRSGVTDPRWLPGAKLNIAKSCFPQSMRNETAIVFQKEGSGTIERLTYDELDRYSNRVANGLVAAGFKVGDAIAIDMPMTVDAVAIYLGIIKAGCVVIGIAESFAADVVATRLRIGKAKGIFTQDFIARGGKKLPMYEKIVQANAPRAVVLPGLQAGKVDIDLRDGDMAWSSFLSGDEAFNAVTREPQGTTNILFSSGTTGDPKAIPWTQTTPIKCGVDGYLHQDIKPGDVVAWPTSLGWMMGPWLIYAALLNRASVAIFYGVPTGREFATFVQESGTTILGVVPALVRAWKNSEAAKGLDWQRIRAFSSTGECSNTTDMLYLMSTAGYKPIIEYCGGTEIGGSYITGTVVQPASPATFSTPTLGLDLVILDENGKSTTNGELFLIPPSIGLSTVLLNRDHYEVYHDGTPTGPNGEQLRRHGDQMEGLAKGFFRAHGRADDTMNLGGIKVSSAEFERVVNTLPEIIETAAIAVPPKVGGPSLLVIYAVLKDAGNFAKRDLQQAMQKVIKTKLNPLFKVHDVLAIEALPRTASNKVMRRVLRAEYLKQMQ